MQKNVIAKIGNGDRGQRMEVKHGRADHVPDGGKPHSRQNNDFGGKQNGNRRRCGLTNGLAEDARRKQQLGVLPEQRIAMQ